MSRCKRQCSSGKQKADLAQLPPTLRWPVLFKLPRCILLIRFLILPCSFAESTLNYTEQKKALRGLVQAFLVTFNDLSIETWLMHGTLLGWWWNKQILPWDSDIDVQVSETSMFFLAAYYNMSVFYHRMPGKPKGREYLLEVNPHYQNRGQTDKLNVIDARWIDMESGLFIDITTVRYNMTHPAGEGMMSCKDGHEFRDTYLFPLRSALFEGVRTKIPYRYRELLVGEYGEKALSLTEFKNHRFDDDQMEWIPVTEEMKSRADL
ncbi:LicD family-domain-containing protein [Lasiosphaeria miniovina]|uniref:LicD family-domain-containing protein n=1 Tax=Lasiosphaeria miniovina TaxID=1954250 RepID=A0AA40BGV0_9PEZI|nr:LicD family-domain-containing protein [Lasiosphaeria miniovina]KAK0733992.1 LicD family-domain-containing protein [Lasiosphaeria miniovina]